jgi:hypothetical protein
MRAANKCRALHVFKNKKSLHMHCTRLLSAQCLPHCSAKIPGINIIITHISACSQKALHSCHYLLARLVRLHLQDCCIAVQVKLPDFLPRNMQC